MANYIQNRFIINGTSEEVAQVLAFIKGEKGAIDFNSILPEPKGIENASAEIDWIFRFRYGYSSNREWREDNWGTLTNAVEIKLDANVLEFKTTWNAPFEIVDRIAECFPAMEFIHQWSEEEIGFNCGECVFKNGGLVNLNGFEDFSEEAYELAFQLWPGKEEEYRRYSKAT